MHTAHARLHVVGAKVADLAGGDGIVKVTIEGDWQAVLEAQKDRVNEWNATLDGRFPDLKSAE